MSDLNGFERLLRVALPLAAFSACGDAPVSEHTVLEGSLEPLRSRFDADSGKVRAIFLASPT